MAIVVHDRELWERVMGYELPATPIKTPSRPREKTPHSGRGAVSSRNNSSSVSVQRSSSQMMRAKEWLSRKATRNMSTEGVTSRMCEEFAVVSTMCEDLWTKESQLLQELDNYLTTQDSRDQRKKEMLYKKWSDRVFRPIQDKLSNWMDTSFEDLDTHRRQLFSQYLDISTHKDVFLDTIVQEEYDPLTITTDQELVKTRVLDDPLLAQLRDHSKEDAVLRDGDRGQVAAAISSPPTPHGEERGAMTDPVLWLTMQLIQVNSKIRQRSRQRLKGIRNLSQMDPGKAEEQFDANSLSRQELRMPHKHPIHYAHHVPVSLEWEEFKPSNSKQKIANKK